MALRPATANITQIDPHGVFLTEVAANTSESDALSGSRTFLDVSLVDPNNPSANLAEITPTGNVFVTLIVVHATAFRVFGMRRLSPLMRSLYFNGVKC